MSKLRQQDGAWGSLKTGGNIALPWAWQAPSPIQSWDGMCSSVFFSPGVQAAWELLRTGEPEDFRGLRARRSGPSLPSYNQGSAWLSTEGHR